MKYLVLKTDDINKFLSKRSQLELTIAIQNIELSRTAVGKGINNYLVINTDEPYADKVKSLIEEHEGEEITFK